MSKDDNKRIMNTESIQTQSKKVVELVEDTNILYTDTWNIYDEIDRISQKNNTGEPKLGYGGGEGLLATSSLASDFPGSINSRTTSYIEKTAEIATIMNEAATFYPGADQLLSSKITERVDELTTLNDILKRYSSFITEDKIGNPNYNAEINNLRSETYSVKTVWDGMVKDIEKHFGNKKDLTSGQVEKWIREKYGDVMSEDNIQIIVAFSNYKMKKTITQIGPTGEPITILKSQEDLFGKDAIVGLVLNEDGTYEVKEIKKGDEPKGLMYFVPNANFSASVSLFGLMNQNLNTGKMSPNAKFSYENKGDGFKGSFPGVNGKMGTSFGASIALLGMRFPDKPFDKDKNTEFYTQGKIEIGKANASVSASTDEIINVNIGVTAAEVSGTIVDIHGRDHGFMVNGTLSVGSASVKAKISIDGVEMKVGVGIIGGGFSLGTYETIDKIIGF